MTAKYQVKKLTTKHDIIAEVPGSKSITNRALLLAAMAEGTTKLTGVLFSEDSRVFMQALKDLGFSCQINEEIATVTIEGCGGKIPLADKGEILDVYVGSAGTAARFLTAYLGLSQGRFRINASEQMKKRPMEELLVCLEEIGADIVYEEEAYHFPFVIGRGEELAHEATISIDKSSQFLSALLIAKPLLPADFSIHITGSHGMKYVEMTQKMIKDFAALPKANRTYCIEPDLSAAAYFYGIGALHGCRTQVKGVHFDSLQGDIAFLQVLEEMGCSFLEEADGLILCENDKKLKGGSFDLSAFSDQALTLAAIAPFCQNPVEIKKIGHIRLQECDRIQAILENMRAMDIVAKEEAGNIYIEPGNPKPALIQTYEDHRVAMAFTLVGTMADGIVIDNPSCCKKTFEGYFDCLEAFVYES